MGWRYCWKFLQSIISASNAVISYINNAGSSYGGNVGIGTSSPDSLLHLKSTGDARMTIQSPDANDAYINFTGSTNEMCIGFDTSDAAMYITNHGTIAANRRVTIKTNGNVGIGTTSPTHTLHVNNSLRASSSLVSIDSTGSASAPSLIFNGDDNSGLYRPASDTLAVSTAGAERMRIDASGNVGIGSTNPRSHRLYLENAGSSGAGQLMLVDSDNSGLQREIRTDAGVLSFDYWDGSNRSNHLTIAANGNVGIGITPTAKLDLLIDTDKRLTFTGGISEIGSVAGFQSINSAGSALKPFGIRAEDIRFATGSMVQKKCVYKLMDKLVLERVVLLLKMAMD